MRTHLVFIDTEFTQLAHNLHDAELISIGLIDYSGERTFYAELTDSYTREQCSDFVIAWVLPLLNAQNCRVKLDDHSVYAQLTTEQARNYLKTWLGKFNGPVELCSDAPKFEEHFLVELFYGHSWPENLLPQVRLCVELHNYIHTIKFQHETEEFFRSGQFKRHHALDDAKVMRLATMSIEP